jgi:hypothetical protein
MHQLLLCMAIPDTIPAEKRGQMIKNNFVKRGLVVWAATAYVGADWQVRFQIQFLFPK